MAEARGFKQRWSCEVENKLNKLTARKIEKERELL